MTNPEEAIEMELAKKNIFQIITEANKSLLVVSGFALIALFLVIYTPFLEKLFHFTSLHPNDLILAFVVACLGTFWFEAIKILRNISLLCSSKIMGCHLFLLKYRYSVAFNEPQSGDISIECYSEPLFLSCRAAT